MTLPPLVLDRKLDTRLWGGSRMAGWLNLTDAPPQLAESWQVYAQNKVSGGAYAGRTLADLTREFGADLVGTRPIAHGSTDFPLLAKFLDAGDALSIQVHPDNDYAHSVEAASGFHGKTEAWYIIEADPDAEVIHGFTRPTDRDEVAAAIAGGTLPEHLRRIPVRAGDTIFVPAGTIHAINAGILLFEIQQTSDLTYRVYDYDRRDAHGHPRELHIEKSLDVLQYGIQPNPHPLPVALGGGGTELVRCPYFALENWELTTLATRNSDPATFEIWTCIAGATTLRTNEDDIRLERGTSVVIPASLGIYTIDAGAALLRCYVPA